MSKKTKKILAIVIPLIIVLLIVLAIVLLIVLNKDVCKGGHTFDKYALSEEDGRCQKICSVCGAKGEIIDHDYKYELVDSSTHKQICKNCGAVGQTLSHNLSYVLLEGDKHQSSCSLCAYQSQAEAHTYQYDIIDGATHRVSCSVCHLIETEELCVYDSATDGTCDKCEYKKDAPSHINISSDKTELKRGEEFTVTMEVTSMRTDCIWAALSLTLGPLNIAGKRLDTDITKSFELVSYTTSLEDYILGYGWGKIIDSSTDNFNVTNSNSKVTCGMTVSIANNGANIPCTQPITITLRFRVKENATACSFNFGIAASFKNSVAYFDANDTNIMYTDQLDQTAVTSNLHTNDLSKTNNASCVMINSIPMSIVE